MPATRKHCIKMCTGGGLGDLMCFLGAARIYAKRRPNEIVYVNVLPQVIGEFEDRLLWFDEQREGTPIDAFRGHRRKQTSPDKNYVGTFLAAMGEAVNEPPALELPRLGSPVGLVSGSYIALQPYSGYARNADDPSTFVQTLIDTCLGHDSKYPVITVGHPATPQNLRGADFSRLGGILPILQLIQHAAIVLTPRSASAHIASAYRIPTFLWLPDDGENWHLDYPKWETCRISVDDSPATLFATLSAFLSRQMSEREKDIIRDHPAYVMPAVLNGQ